MPTRLAAFTVGRVAAGLVVLSALVRAWTLFRGYFYIDDFAFTGRAMEYPPWSLTYLTHPYNSHLMPGSYVWVWLTTRAFPLDWAPVAAVILVLQLVLSFLLYGLLVELFGPRRLVLVPLTIAVLSPISLPAFLWWAAALNQLPQQLATTAALLFLVRYLRTGHRRLALAGPAALAVGLLFSEKTLFLVPLALALTLVFFTSGPAWSRVVHTARHHAVLWGAYAVVVVPYLVYYLRAVPSPLRTTPAGHDIADLVTQSLFRATVPGLLGGPWTWAKVGFAGGLADPNSFMVVASFLVVAVIVAATVVWWRGAAGAWLIALGYICVNLALLARSRATVIGPVIGTEYRYQSDLAMIVAVALGLAAMPIAGRFAAAEVQRLRPRTAARAWLVENVAEPLRRVRLVPVGGAEVRRAETAVVAVAVLALGASSTLSSLRYDPLWVDNPARRYVTTVVQELGGLPDGVVLADTSVPENVAWGFIAPYNESYRVLAPVLTPAQRLDPGHAVSTIVVPDDSGHLRLGAVAGVHAESGPVPGCGWALGDATVTIPLRATAPDKQPVIRIGYIASAATTLTVTVDGRATTVPVDAGLGARYLATRGPMSELTVSGSGDNVRVCTDDIIVGAPVAIPGTTP